ncbi:MAG: glycerol-3-phosphate 1-O-acyltransferase PlsY [Chloroflexota bacterium]
MEILIVVFSYLVGSIPTGVIVGKLMGIDVRSAGSGNIGATNVARVLGKGKGALTLLADAAKGYLPVFIARQLGVDSNTEVVVGAAAFLGHLYPIYLKFRGGKGVATALGALLLLAPLAILILLAVFAAAFLTSRIVSLGSIAAAAALPMALWLLSYPPQVIVLGAFLGAMVILRHRANIRRLFAGTEPRFGSR